MSEQRDEGAELREVCLGLAIQAGAREAVQIVGLAESLKAYVERGEIPVHTLRRFSATGPG